MRRTTGTVSNDCSLTNAHDFNRGAKRKTIHLSFATAEAAGWVNDEPRMINRGGSEQTSRNYCKANSYIECHR